jgi:hypothetical protein
MLKLAHDLEFTDLHRRAGLERVDAAFLAHVAAVDAPLHAALLGARAHPEALAPKAESELLIALAPHLEDFTARLFGIEAEAAQLAAAHHELAPVFSVKRLFVQRVALLKVKPEQLAGFDPDAAERELLGETFSELGFAQRVSAWQCDEAANAERLALAARYAAWAAGTDAGRARHAGGVLFKTPAKLDYQNLVPIATRETLGFTRHSIDHLRRREGFALTDPGTDLYGALDEANYCIWCHNQGKDSCSHGFRDKAPKGSDPARAPFRKSVLGVTLPAARWKKRSPSSIS